MQVWISLINNRKNVTEGSFVKIVASQIQIKSDRPPLFLLALSSGFGKAFVALTGGGSSNFSILWWIWTQQAMRFSLRTKYPHFFQKFRADISFWWFVQSVHSSCQRCFRSQNFHRFSEFDIFSKIFRITLSIWEVNKKKNPFKSGGIVWTIGW